MKEERTARLTVLIDPRKKALFERLCEEEDVTPSQVVRRAIREFIEERMGPGWWEQLAGEGAGTPEEEGTQTGGARAEGGTSQPA